MAEWLQITLTSMEAAPEGHRKALNPSAPPSSSARRAAGSRALAGTSPAQNPTSTHSLPCGHAPASNWGISGQWHMPCGHVWLRSNQPYPHFHMPTHGMHQTRRSWCARGRSTLPFRSKHVAQCPV